MFGLFKRSELPLDDRQRLNRLVEAVESLTRRYEGLVADLDEFYAKVNRARQRVDKQDRDAKDKEKAAAAVETHSAPSSRAERKDQLRASLMRR